MKNFIALLIFIVAVVVIVFGVVPMWSKITSIKGEVATYRQAVSDFRESLKLQDSLLLSYNSIDRTLLDRLDEIVPPDPDITSLIKTVEGIAVGTGIRLRSLDFAVAQEEESDNARLRSGESTPEQRGPFRTVTITMNIEGSYDNMHAFLENMEKSLRLIDLSSMTFSAVPGSALSVSITASAYYGKTGN